MNFDFALQINPELEKFNFGKAIKIAESELSKLPLTDSGFNSHIFYRTFL